jgi:hypothetical protein
MHNYITRKRVIGYHRANYLNIIRYATRLLSLNFSSKTEVEKLRAAVMAEEHLSEKEWLLTMILI